MLTPTNHQLRVVEKFKNVTNYFIGDSMGVGKTLSAILLDFEDRKLHNSRARSKKHPYHTLIISTKSGMAVWEEHLIDQGVDPSRIFVIDPSDREPFDQELARGEGNLRYDYFICHWQSIHRLEHLQKHPGKPAVKWDHIIADEIQYAKNPKTLTFRALKKIPAWKKGALSGTPADDKPNDFWAPLNWLYPSDYRSYWRFYDEVIEWVAHPTRGFRMAVGVKNVPQLHKKISPFYIRRTLHDVREDMPPKIHGRIWVDLTDRQRSDYEDMKEFQIARVGEAREELLASYMIEMYTRLQQMTLGTVSMDWTKYNEWYEEYGQYGFDTGSTRYKGPKKIPSYQVVIGEPSPKYDAVMEKVQEAVDSGEQIVVFSQFKQVVDGIRARLAKTKVPATGYHGGQPDLTFRKQAAADFQAGKARVFVGGIKSAGTAITLTAANTLIFTDRVWNPSANEQAEDRIWRINQYNACRIWDIVARDTNDNERLDRIHLKGEHVRQVVNLPDHLK